MINKALKILQTEGPPTQACVMLVPESQHVEGENKMKWGKHLRGITFLIRGHCSNLLKCQMLPQWATQYKNRQKHSNRRILSFGSKS